MFVTCFKFLFVFWNCIYCPKLDTSLQQIKGWEWTQIKITIPNLSITMIVIYKFNEHVLNLIILGISQLPDRTKQPVLPALDILSTCRCSLHYVFSIIGKSKSIQIFICTNIHIYKYTVSNNSVQIVYYTPRKFDHRWAMGAHNIKYKIYQKLFNSPEQLVAVKTFTVTGDKETAWHWSTYLPNILI